MPVVAKCYVTINVRMGEGHDEIGTTPKYAMDDLKAAGWTGNTGSVSAPSAVRKEQRNRTEDRKGLSMEECYIVVHRNYADGCMAYAFRNEEDARKDVEDDKGTQ